MRIARTAAALALILALLNAWKLMFAPMGQQCSFSMTATVTAPTGHTQSSVEQVLPTGSENCKPAPVAWSQPESRKPMLVIAALLIVPTLLPLLIRPRAGFIAAYLAGCVILVLGCMAGMVLPFFFWQPALTMLAGGLLSMAWSATSRWRGADSKKPA